MAQRTMTHEEIEQEVQRRLAEEDVKHATQLAKKCLGEAVSLLVEAEAHFDRAQLYRRSETVAELRNSIGRLQDTLST